MVPEVENASNTNSFELSVSVVDSNFTVEILDSIIVNPAVPEISPSETSQA